ncbi:MAG: hypothetical protein M1156_00490 [Candidatus Marsarchaeota archaeon]|jgi:hypothetical protein|nr:hypothetical protein [Candidatus Marsarchaeota archaeon]
MADEINFMDIAVLLKITPGTPLEKLGGIMNASIFDASNIAGSMKQKGLIEFTAYYPGPNGINITDAGKALLTEAESKTSAPYDQLDAHILEQLSGGRRLPLELQNTLNINSRDLAMRLYKESKQGFIIYDLKNGNVDLMLTEKGFLQAKSGPMQSQATVAATGPALGIQAAAQQTTQQVVKQQTQTQSAAQIPQQNVQQPYSQPAPQPSPIQQNQQAGLKSEKKKWIIIGILIVVLVVLYVLTRRIS